MRAGADEANLGGLLLQSTFLKKLQQEGTIETSKLTSVYWPKQISDLATSTCS